MAEVCTSDAVMGVCLFSLMFFMTLQAMTATYFMNTKLGIHGMFYVLGCVNLVGFVLMYTFIKET